MGVTVKRSVRVKVVVTEQFKTHRATEVRVALAKLETVKKRLDYESETLSRRTDADSKLVERLNVGQRNNERARAALLRELEAITSLTVGSEYDRGALEGLVEVEVGDDFSILASCEIVVKDDKIIEIRNGLCPEITEI